MTVLDHNTKSGGEGTVHFTADNKYAVKLYHESTDPEKIRKLALKEPRLLKVMETFHTLPDSQSRFILPPLAIVDMVNGVRRTGFLMRKAPAGSVDLVNFVLHPVAAARQFQQGRRWADFLRAAHSIALAMVVLHGKGCAHSDVSYKNFLVDLSSGQAVMLESDGICVEGWLHPEVAGTPGFIAPEVITQRIPPNVRTDRHSLAILLLHTLLFRNVLQPLIEYADNQEDSEYLGWGANALFSEHSRDRRHRPKTIGLPLYSGGALSYTMLPPALQRLTERALIDGLHQPSLRPAAREWADALAALVDEIWMCVRCKQTFPYPHWQLPAARRSCSFCGIRLSPPYPAVLTLAEERRKHEYHPVGRTAVLGHGFLVFSELLEPGSSASFARKSAKPVGHVEYDRRSGRYQLFNDDGGCWTSSALDGRRQKQATKGQSLPLEPTDLIHFGEGKRIAFVQE